MVVGTYRTDEVALGRAGKRHPLEPVLAELQRRLGDVQLDLEEAEGRSFIDAFVDSEPNQLDEGFRQALLAHTDGYALFTVELLRDMQERGYLVQDKKGRWVAKKDLRQGDLVFFATKGGTRVTHVGMYVGGGEFIHAPRTGKKVRIEKLSNSFFAKTYMGGRTYL